MKAFVSVVFRLAIFFIFTVFSGGLLLYGLLVYMEEQDKFAASETLVEVVGQSMEGEPTVTIATTRKPLIVFSVPVSKDHPAYSRDSPRCCWWYVHGREQDYLISLPSYQ